MGREKEEMRREYGENERRGEESGERYGLEDFSYSQGMSHMMSDCAVQGRISSYRSKQSSKAYDINDVRTVIRKVLIFTKKFFLKKKVVTSICPK